MNWGIYRFIFAQELRRLLAYRANVWLTVLGVTAMRVFSGYIVWLGVYQARGFEPIDTLTFPQMVLYITVASCITDIVGANWSSNISGDIYQGSLTRYLIYPISVIPYKLTGSIAQMLLRTVQLAVCGAIMLFLLDVSLLATTSGGAFIMTGVSIIAATILTFFLYFCVELCAFWAGEVYGLALFVGFIIRFAGGSLIPLSLLPTSVNQALYFTPFPYITYEPTRALMSGVSLHEWLTGLGITTLWIVLFAALSYTILEKGRRVYTGVGI